MAMKSVLYNNSVQTILRSMAILAAMFLGNIFDQGTLILRSDRIYQ